MKHIEVLEYNPIYKIKFEEIKKEILPFLSNYIINIEHIGSTSVVNLYSKPIIDINIIIKEDMFDIVKAQLLLCGYSHEGNQGIAGREVFKYTNKGHLMKHHLYVCNDNSLELKKHLIVRGFLTHNKEYRDQYSQLKINLAKKYPNDIDNYINGKESLLFTIYQKAGLNILDYLNFRKATINDTNELFRLNNLFNGPDSASKEYIMNSLKEDIEKVFVAELNGRIYGFCAGNIIYSFCYGVSYFEITELFVMEEYRKNKIGSRLIKAMENYIKELGINDIQLFTNKKNNYAQSFYEHMDYYSCDDILYRKKL